MSKRKSKANAELQKCTIWWCDSPRYANGYCKAHDIATHRYGTPYGKHYEQYKKIEDAILKARLIALAVTEFASPTEFALNALQSGERVVDDIGVCPFCGESNHLHLPLCAVKLSKSLLESTEYKLYKEDKNGATGETIAQSHSFTE